MILADPDQPLEMCVAEPRSGHSDSGTGLLATLEPEVVEEELSSVLYPFIPEAPDIASSMSADLLSVPSTSSPTSLSSSGLPARMSSPPPFVSNPLTPPLVLSPNPLLPPPVPFSVQHSPDIPEAPDPDSSSSANVSSAMPMISAASASATPLLPPGCRCYDTPSLPCLQSSLPIPSSICDTPSIPAQASLNSRITLDEALQVVGEHIEAAGDSVIEPLHPAIAYLCDQIHKEEQRTILQLLIFLHSQLDISDTEAEEDHPDHAVPMPDPDPPPTYAVDSSPTPIPDSSHALDSDTRLTQPASSTAIPYADDPPSIPNATPLQTFPSDATSEGDQSFRNDSFL